MKTRRRKKYNTRKYGNKRIRYNKRKSRKMCNAKKKKSRRRRKQRKNLTESGRGLWDDAYEIDILGDEPVILGDDGMTEDERLQHKTEEFSNNFFRTGIIKWKRRAREQEINRMEPGWVFVHGGDHDEDNYVKYLLEQWPENITKEYQLYSDDNPWIRADNADLATEASSLLVGDLTDKTGENYWIDKRVLGPKWRGLFDATNADDEIRTMEVPE